MRWHGNTLKEQLK